MVNKKDEITTLKRSQPSISHSNRFFPGFCSFVFIKELFLLLIKIPLTLNLSHAYFSILCGYYLTCEEPLTYQASHISQLLSLSFFLSQNHL